MFNVDDFDNRPDLVFPASNTWGLSDFIDREWTLLGIATVGLFNCLGNIRAFF